MTTGDDQLRVLFFADFVGRGLDARLTRLAMRIENFVDLILGTWGGEAEPGVMAEAVSIEGNGRKMSEFIHSVVAGGPLPHVGKW
jgi:hypothetical protein